jgi:hypothetical protein
MRILVSSLVLDLSGTPTYTLVLYNELVKRGHDVAVYSPGSGPLSKQMRTVTTLAGMKPPDVIMAQMNVCAEEMRKAFPNVPMIFSAHGVTPETETPPSVDVQWYTAINEDGADNLVAHGVNLNKINIVRDFIDTNRFKPIRPLNEKPKCILFLNNFKKWKTHAIIHKACQKLGIEFKAVGSPYGRSREVEKEINWADLVIGVGRCLLEGMACGRPVISFSQRRGDGYITPELYMESRTRNFAQHKCRHEFDVDGLINEIKKYDPADGKVNRHLVMIHHNHVLGVDKLLSVIGEGEISKHGVNTLDYIVDRYKLNLNVRAMPVEIPNVGRDNLTKLFAELDFKSGLELGVEEGLYTEILCRENPQAMIYGVDPWRSYPGYREHVSQTQLDGFYEGTRKRLVPYGNYKLIKKFSMEAVHDFEDESLDFVYLDGNHTLKYIINDLIEWSKKVRKGGIVSGHDYRKSRRMVTLNHVPYAVECYTQSYRIRPWFVLGRKAKIEGEVRDGSRSWMWVKPR